MKQARLYVRVSTDEQAKKGLSIPVQIEKLKQYCQENDYEVADIYIDNGISASTIKKRHEFVRMLDELQQDDTILITRFDRMSRNVYDANYLLKIFEPLNVRFKAILEDDIDTTTADGKFIFDLKVSLAERERKKTSERIRDIFESKRAKGEWTAGIIPLGYRISSDRHLELDPATSEAVKYLFEQFDRTHSIREIQSYLKSTYGIDYTISSLYKVLGNKRYYGYYGDTPIVSESLYHSANAKKLIINHYEKTKGGRVYLFQTLVKCPCGHTMTSRTVKKSGKYYIEYRCREGLYDKSDFVHRGITEPKLEKIFLDDLEQKVATSSMQVNTVDEMDSKLKALHEAIEKQSRLKEMYIEGFINRERFDSEMASIEPILATRFEEESKFSELSDIINIKDFYNGLSKKEKQVFISSLVREIQVDDKRKITIKYK